MRVEQPGNGVASTRPGGSPLRNPQVILLLALAVGAVVLAFTGVTAGPTPPGGDDEGSIFPVVDLLTDDREEVALSLSANRTDLTAGDAVAFEVTQGDGEPVGNASVVAAGQRRSVDDEGRVVVRIESAGEFTATASAPATDAAVYTEDELALTVVPRTVRLTVAANRSTATVGEPIALDVRRADTGEPVTDGVLIGTLAPDGRLVGGAPAVRRLGDGRVVVTPDRAGSLVVVGLRGATVSERAGAAYRTIPVERRSVALDVSVDRSEVVVGESVTATVTRADTGQPVDATVEVDDRSLATDADGTATFPVDAVGEWTVRATAERTPTERFDPATASLSVERRPVDLDLAIDRPALTVGGAVGVELTRADDGTPVPGTIVVGDEPVVLDADGTAVVTVDRPGTVTVTGTAPETDTETFEPATATLEVSDTTIERGAVVVTDGETTIENESLVAPESVAPGARLAVRFEATNTGQETGTDTVVLAVGQGDPVSSGDGWNATAVTLGPGESGTVDLSVRVPDEPGPSELVLRTSAGTDRTTVEVQPADG